MMGQDQLCQKFRKCHHLSPRYDFFTKKISDLLLTRQSNLYRKICDILQLCLRLLLTAKHCIAKYFYDWCVEESDCYAYFRDLVAGPANHERGQFTVPLIEMYEKEGRSDLAIVKLAFEV